MFLHVYKLLFHRCKYDSRALGQIPEQCYQIFLTRYEKSYQIYHYWTPALEKTTGEHTNVQRQHRCTIWEGSSFLFWGISFLPVLRKVYLFCYSTKAYIVTLHGDGSVEGSQHIKRWFGPNEGSQHMRVQMRGCNIWQFKNEVSKIYANGSNEGPQVLLL